jgi:hypothetical protein
VLRILSSENSHGMPIFPKANSSYVVILFRNVATRIVRLPAIFARSVARLFVPLFLRVFGHANSHSQPVEAVLKREQESGCGLENPSSERFAVQTDDDTMPRGNNNYPAVCLKTATDKKTDSTFQLVPCNTPWRHLMERFEKFAEHVMPRGDGMIVVTDEGCRALHELLAGFENIDPTIVDEALTAITTMVVGMGSLAKRQLIVFLVISLSKASALPQSIQRRIGRLLQLTQMILTPEEAVSAEQIEKCRAEAAKARTMYLEATAKMQKLKATNALELQQIADDMEKKHLAAEAALRKQGSGFFVNLWGALFRSS